MHEIDRDMMHVNSDSDSDEMENFPKLNTDIIAGISLAFGIVIQIIGLSLSSEWSPDYSKCNSYFILLYLHCGYWFIIMIVTHIIKTKHHKLRMSGYLDFYKSTNQYVSTPIFISSLWNTIYLLLAVILHHTHKQDYDDYCRLSEWFTPVNYILLLSTLKLMIIDFAYLNYIKRVRDFNYAHPSPDVMRDEWLSLLTQDSYASSAEVNYQERSFNVRELLEKQADLIRYLRDHNAELNHRFVLYAFTAHRNNL